MYQWSVIRVLTISLIVLSSCLALEDHRLILQGHKSLSLFLPIFFNNLSVYFNTFLLIDS